VKANFNFGLSCGMQSAAGVALFVHMCYSLQRYKKFETTGGENMDAGGSRSSNDGLYIIKAQDYGGAVSVRSLC